MVVDKVRKLAMLFSALVIALVVVGGSVAQAEHYGCQEITAWLFGSQPMRREICYPCMPTAALPPGTPAQVKLVWQTQICPTSGGGVLPTH
jgi:hypothetical protein